MQNELESIFHIRVNHINFLIVDMNYRKPHLHFELEFVFVLEGSGVVQTLGNNFHISAGQGIIFNSCQTHEFISETSLKMLILQIDTTLLNDFFPKIDKILFESKPFNFNEMADLKTFLFASAISYFEETNFSPLKVLGYTSLLLDILVNIRKWELLNSTQQSKHLNLQERILSITSFIHQNYTNKITLEEVALREGLSRTYFSHFFKKNFGITFQDYVNNLRSEHARLLLSTTNETILSICYSSGFSDMRTLNKAFTKYYGISPKVFRRYDYPIQRISFIQDKVDNQKIYSNTESLIILNQLKQSPPK